MNRATFLRLLLLAPLGGRQASAAAISNDISLDYLLRRQSADGAWRSTTYGAFRDGRALTPHVLRCLSRFDDPDLASAKEKAVTWLIARKSDLFQAFPVHLASAVWESATRIDSLELLCVPAVEKLLSLQTSSGAWSYSPVPLRRAVIPSAMQQPNLSATAIAIDGLRAAGAHEDTITRAIPFLRTCQNHNSGDPDFDDGGFFQMPLDPTRNKAGQAGVDRIGRMRFVSYAAATADGLRCLLSIPTAEDSERIAAAREWLKAFKWSAAGSSSSPRDLVYYAARSISATAALEPKLSCLLPFIRSQLNESQLTDGSWQNPSAEMRENCQLVATTFALEALIGVDSSIAITAPDPG